MKIKNGTILIATKNKGKIKEFENMLKGFDISVKTLYDYDIPNIEETGNTFFQNALIKAKKGYEASGLLTIADDSGLEVEALDGAPGIYSARFGGEGLNDEERIEYLLDKLKNVKNRKARFITSLVIYNGNDKNIKEFKGIWNGEILENPIGDNGFGYDPIFYDYKLKKSAAELSPDEKKLVSHRGKAMNDLIEFLKEIL